MNIWDSYPMLTWDSEADTTGGDGREKTETDDRGEITEGKKEETNLNYGMGRTRGGFGF